MARALAWLARQQRADGSWVYDMGDKGEIIAATGMALLPFLAAGETHKSAKTYQKTVRSALEYLVKCCPTGGPNAGKFIGAGNMYAQAIGTLALCEAYGMTKDKALLATQRSGRDQLHPDGPGRKRQLGLSVRQRGRYLHRRLAGSGAPSGPAEQGTSSSMTRSSRKRSRS